eukprot:TRINITY_DN6944_c0_g1_i1.p1 TRINITY_DN6944_c0_g1~~TRINITY_DN6944_c0_g1_i1.p1  ORF type:complete len:127 (+),score=12.29 TRINITY_DN6944_c0_g1_i1:89-469(+)
MDAPDLLHYYTTLSDSHESAENDSELTSSVEEQLVEWAFLKNSQGLEIDDKQSDHSFERTTFSSPTFCNYCQQFIFGLLLQGYACKVCGYASHGGCLKWIPKDCKSSLASKASSEKIDLATARTLR